MYVELDCLELEAFVDGEYEDFEGDLSISDSVKPQTSTKFSENVTQVLESFYYDMNMDGGKSITTTFKGHKWPLV